ncbi:hypothetical protein [Streptomyces sp. NPDC057199]|uniref:hypothetical protein n=1 Tax=Streptomyces sp. NPDC057199 TaxID=3346047 RepID=UPI0036361CB0
MDKQIRSMAGMEDPIHTRSIESATVELLRDWGADARLSQLGDHCADRNGHLLFWQHDQAQLLDVLGEQILAVCA